jgi:hypothetical protein
MHRSSRRCPGEEGFAGSDERKCGGGRRARPRTARPKPRAWRTTAGSYRHGDARPRLGYRRVAVADRTLAGPTRPDKRPAVSERSIRVGAPGCAVHQRGDGPPQQIIRVRLADSVLQAAPCDLQRPPGGPRRQLLQRPPDIARAQARQRSGPDALVQRAHQPGVQSLDPLCPPVQAILEPVLDGTLHGVASTCLEPCAELGGQRLELVPDFLPGLAAGLPAEAPTDRTEPSDTPPTIYRAASK